MRLCVGEGMSDQKVHFMSENQAWGTPRSFMAFLEERFNFSPTLDAAATVRNTKAPRFYNPTQDGLKHPWNGKVWLNPPFGRELPRWLEKCAEEIKTNDRCEVIYCLIPARTDTRWFHDIVMPNAYLAYLIKGRFNFVAPGTAEGANAPFPSMLVVWRRHNLPDCGITTLEVPKEARGYD